MMKLINFETRNRACDECSVSLASLGVETIVTVDMKTALRCQMKYNSIIRHDVSVNYKFISACFV